MINLYFIRLNDSAILTMKQLKKVERKVLRLLTDVGVKYKSHGIGEWEMPLVQATTNPFQTPGLIRTKLFMEHPEIEPKDYYHVFCGPIYQGMYKFFGGAGGCICCQGSEGRMSISTAFDNRGSLNSSANSMIHSNAVIAAHEIAHVLGAKHIDDAYNIMHSQVNVWWKHDDLKWLPRSKKQIRSCLK